MNSGIILVGLYYFLLCYKKLAINPTFSKEEVLNK